MLESSAAKTIRVGRRLYIYMAGRGFGSSAEETALLMPNATTSLVDSIQARGYADYFGQSGLFDEVVLVVDCTREIPLGAIKPAMPPWAFLSSPGTLATGFYAFAAVQGSEARNAPLTGEGTEVHGIFTSVLLEGLRGAAADPDGSVTSDSLRSFVSRRFRTLDLRPPPHFAFSGHEQIVFVDRTERKELSQAGGESAAPPAEEMAESGAPAGDRGSGGVAGKRSQWAEAERVATQTDDPAIVDELGRRPFAEVVAARIDEVWNGRSAGRPREGDGPEGAFMVHIHGPWGAGKTSVLNFLRARLQDEKREPVPNAPAAGAAAGRPPPDRWVVVEFNAWRNQQIRPPWWTLVRAIYSQSAKQVGFLRSLQLRLLWLWWRARADLLPTLATVVLILTVVLLATGWLDLVPDPGAPVPPAKGGGVPLDSVADSLAAAPARGGGTPAATTASDVAKTVELALKIITAIFAAAAAVYAFSRSLVFGSARAAQTYTELSSDPLGPIVGLFQKLVKRVRRAVAVFIDDLDRCEGKYVVELLEGIQTLFRAAPVTYVVAADRKWICSSFDKSYEDFGKTIGEPGRPLGYLFLDKVFQVSVSVPRPSPEVRARYWEALLGISGTGDPVVREEKLKQEEAAALESVQHIHTQEQLEEKIAEVQGQPQEPAMRAAAAKQITSARARQATEHRLQRFAGLLEPNPRSMKRLVNAYGLQQAAHFLEGRVVSPDALARWTIIELRWPLLADFLAASPQCVGELANGTSAGVPRELKPLFASEEVKAVVRGADGALALDEAAIREIVGLGRAPVDAVAAQGEDPSGS